MSGARALGRALAAPRAAFERVHLDWCQLGSDGVAPLVDELQRARARGDLTLVELSLSNNGLDDAAGLLFARLGG